MLGRVVAAVAGAVTFGIVIFVVPLHALRQQADIHTWDLRQMRTIEAAPANVMAKTIQIVPFEPVTHELKRMSLGLDTCKILHS